MNPANLRNRITIQRVSTGVDDYGQPSDTWTDVATLSAQVTAKGVRESVIGGRVQSVVIYEIMVRYRDDILPTDRVQYKGFFLAINGVADREGNRKYLHIWASQGQAT